MDKFIESIIKLTQNNKNLSVKKGKILVKEIDYKRKKYKADK